MWYSWSKKDHEEPTIDQIRTVENMYCKGNANQYPSIDACKQYLRTEVSFGNYDQGDQSNVACRLTHSYFIPINPFRYCPRVGPSGGGICTNKTFDFYYNQPDFLACAHKYT